MFAPRTKSIPTIAAALSVTMLLAIPSNARSESGGAQLSSMVKLKSWDADSGLGVFKTSDGEFAVLQVDERSRIRVDKPVRAGEWQFLSQHATDELHCFAKKDFYQAPGRTVGALKPRIILAAGYAIEPLPQTECRVPGVFGILGWHTASEPDWKTPGTARVGGLFDLGLNSRELILMGTPGDHEDIRKGRRLHVLAEDTSEVLRLTRGGRLLDPEKVSNHVGILIEAPVFHATRVVVLHKAFKHVYRYCFEDTFQGPASRRASLPPRENFVRHPRQRNPQKSKVAE